MPQGAAVRAAPEDDLPLLRQAGNPRSHDSNSATLAPTPIRGFGAQCVTAARAAGPAEGPIGAEEDRRNSGGRGGPGGRLVGGAGLQAAPPDHQPAPQAAEDAPVEPPARPGRRPPPGPRPPPGLPDQALQRRPAQVGVAPQAHVLLDGVPVPRHALPLVALVIGPAAPAVRLLPRAPAR